MRQSSLRYVLSILLAAMLLLGNGLQFSAQAADDSMWNPTNWFKGDKQEVQSEEGRTRLLEARRKAEEAQRRAEEALMQAAQAQQEAEKARKVAEEEMEKANAKRKPKVSFQELKPEKSEAIATPAIEEREAHQPETESGFFKTENLNPMNWFKGSEDKQATVTTAPEKEKKKKEEPKLSVAPAAAIPKAAVIETQKGNITIELFPEAAPQTVANFTRLVEEGFYNKFNMKFHRVIQDFVIQTGDPTGTGAGGSSQRIPLEVDNKLSHNTKGMVAMARGPDPNSATSQFYITLAPQTSLDGKYAIFGRVIAGMDVLSKIEKQDMLYGIRLVDLNTVVRDPEPEKKGFFSKVF